MKNKDILVSVVIPTYSRNTTLERAINSALEQTHENIEILVVDDNPSDSEWRASTEKLMKKFSDNEKVVYVQNVQNLGGSGARNEGIKRAKGEYVAFLDDDDEYFPERIEKQLNLFLTSNNDKLALVFCDAVMTYGRDEIVCYTRPHYKGCCIYEAMRDNCLAATSQWMAKKSALLDVEMFTIVPCKQDSTLILKLLASGYEVDCVPEVLSKYCNYSGGRISDTGKKNLDGELAYKRRCEEQYHKLTDEQIKEVEYSFAKRLKKLYKANNMKKEKNECWKILFRTHPVKTLKNEAIRVLQDIKNRKKLEERTPVG